MLGELAQLFLQEAPTLLARINAAVAASDAAALRHAAHTLKGSAAVFGATATADIARHLEQRARDGALDGAAPDAARLVLETNRLLTSLRAAI